MRCRAVSTLWVLALSVAPTVAQEPAAHSSACRDALAALQARESVLAAAAASQPSSTVEGRPRHGGDRPWLALRARAAAACLGAGPDTPTPAPQSRTAPIVVPPVTLTPSPPRTTRPPSPPSPPIVERRMPPAPGVNCDARGCDTGDGRRLPHTGRNPLDPGARCTVQGSLVVCV